MSTLVEALHFYNKVLDQIIPTIKDWERVHQDYSDETAQLIGEVINLINDAQDKYFMAAQSIYEWCGLIERLLATYLEKGTSTTYITDRVVLLKLLDEGPAKITDGQAKNEQCSITLNNVARTLNMLGGVKDVDDKLRQTIKKTSADINETKNKLQDEIMVIGRLKVNVEETRIYILEDQIFELRDIIKTSVENLIKECKNYEKRHGKE